MESIKKLIMELDSCNDNWKNLTLKDVREQKNDEFAEKIEDIFKLLKEKYYDNKEVVTEFVEAEMGEMADSLIDALDRATYTFFSFDKLRELDGKNDLELKMLIRLLIDEAMVRFNPEILERYQDFKCLTKEELIEIIVTFEGLTDFYISKKFTIEMIAKDFQGETSFSDEISYYYANLINKNYHTLQMNLILDKLQEHLGDE